jgi:hypothetical protein
MSGSFVEVADNSSASSGPVRASSGGMFDSSGWTVATSGARATGAASTIPPWVWYVAAGLAVLYAVKKMKRGYK